MNSKTWHISLALMLSAASALIYEVIATNTLFFYFAESSYSIATVLSVFLFGLGVGSLLIYHTSHKIQNKKRVFFWFQLVLAVYAFLILANLQSIIPHISPFGIIAVTFFILFIPTVLLGAVFPLANSMFVHEKKEVVGLVYSLDLFGAILGTVVAGFFLIPLYGNTTTIFVGVACNFLSAFTIAPQRRHKWIVGLFIFLFIMFSVVAVQNNKAPTLQELQEKTFSKPSAFGLVKVEYGMLYIDERDQCAMNYAEDASERQMVSYALAPFQKKNIQTLNIGLGCGLTLQHLMNEVSGRVDVVEINPVIVEANKFMSNVLKDRQANLIIEDGLAYLRNTNKKYHSILIDIENPTIAHSSPLYTVDAFQLVQQKLTNDGTFALWTYHGNHRYTDIIYYSMKEVFPYVYHYDGVLLASQQKLDKEEYSPNSEETINTIEKNTLSQAYGVTGTPAIP